MPKNSYELVFLRINMLVIVVVVVVVVGFFIFNHKTTSSSTQKNSLVKNKETATKRYTLNMLKIKI